MERDHLIDSIHNSIILKHDLKQYNGRVWTGFTVKDRHIADSFEHGNVPLVSINF
jgi:hypothetical protein